MHYRRVSGTTAEKLAAMDRVTQQEDPLDQGWIDVNGDPIASFVPVSADSVWEKCIQIDDLFPWQLAGCMAGRVWPISPSRETLELRWKTIASAPKLNRPLLLKESPTGRDVSSSPYGLFSGSRLTPIINVMPTDLPETYVRYGWRSFDRQWLVADNRLLDRASPTLWAAHSSAQIYIASMISKLLGPGPSVTVSCELPDRDVFSGRGGKDVMPLYRDAKAEEPNITRGLLTKLGKQLSRPAPKPEALAAYVYAVLSSPRYQERFAEALKTPGPRVPMTADAALWDEAVALGTWLLWLHTYAERLQDKTKGRGRYVPFVSGLDWQEPVRTMPETKQDIHYDADTQVLSVGDGRVGGVSPEVWEYRVSGWPVVDRWLGYRTKKGAGKATSSESALDHIRPTAWADEWNDELLELLRVLTLTVEKHPEQALLVDRICDGPLIPASELPKPKDAERKPPKGE